MKNREGRNKYLAKNILIFTLGDIGSKIITFLLIPLYTHYLSTEQYGTIDLVTVVSMFAVPLLTLNISEAIMRFSLDKDADQKQNTQIGSVILLIATILTLVIIYPICQVIDGISNYAGYISLYVISSAASQIYLGDLRGKELLLKFAIGNILMTFSTAVFNIIFLVGLGLGIEGYLLAYTLANFVTAIYAVIAGQGYKAFGFDLLDKQQIKKMTAYSVVLIPNTFMWWIMNSSDRIMVTAMVGAAANGIYAISYKLPSIVSVLMQIVNKAWSFSAIREENAKDEAAYNNKMLRVITGWSMIIGLFILAISKPFLHIYVAPAFYSAWLYVPYLIIGCVYMTLGSFLATSYTVHKDSWGFLFSSIFGALINIVLNFLLIPRFQVHGAAFATGVSYIGVFAFRYFHTQKYLHYRIFSFEFAAGSAFLILSAVLTYVDTFASTGIQFGLFILAVIAFARDWLPIIRVVFSKIYLRRREHENE